MGFSGLGVGLQWSRGWASGSRGCGILAGLELWARTGSWVVRVSGLSWAEVSPWCHGSLRLMGRPDLGWAELLLCLMGSSPRFRSLAGL
jgi:hypothetical protein